MILFSGFFEPLFYLVFFVYPLGDFIGDFVFNDKTLEYAAFVGPALLAASAMNGAFYDATNVFWKLRYAKVYDAMLSTPISPGDVAVGETMWAVVRSLALLVRVLQHPARPRPDRVVVGRADPPRLLRDRLRIRRGRDRRCHLDAELAGLRPHPARDAPDVPLLRDLLSDHRSSRRSSSGWCASCRSTTGSSSSGRSRPGRSAPTSCSTSCTSRPWASSGLFVASRRIDGLLLK